MRLVLSCNSSAETITGKSATFRRCFFFLVCFLLPPFGVPGETASLPCFFFAFAPSDWSGSSSLLLLLLLRCGVAALGAEGVDLLV